MIHEYARSILVSIPSRAFSCLHPTVQMTRLIINMKWTEARRRYSILQVAQIRPVRIKTDKPIYKYYYLLYVKNLTTGKLSCENMANVPMQGTWQEKAYLIRVSITTPHTILKYAVIEIMHEVFFKRQAISSL